MAQEKGLDLSVGCVQSLVEFVERMFVTSFGDCEAHISSPGPQYRSLSPGH